MVDNKHMIGISFRWDDFDCCHFSDILHEYVQILRNGELIYAQYNGSSDEPVETFKYKAANWRTELFFKKAENTFFGITNKKQYNVEVCDGFQWKITYCLDNKIDITVKGTIAAPKESYDMVHYLLKLAPFPKIPNIMCGTGLYNNIPIETVLCDRKAYLIADRILQKDMLGADAFRNRKVTFAELGKHMGRGISRKVFQELVVTLEEYYNAPCAEPPLLDADEPDYVFQRLYPYYFFLKELDNSDVYTDLEGALGEDLRELGFKMDCFQGFKDKGYTDDTLNDMEKLKSVLPELDRAMIGSLIYSQWRYLTHWAYSFSWEEYAEFFIYCMETLFKTKE